MTPPRIPTERDQYQELVRRVDNLERRRIPKPASRPVGGSKPYATVVVALSDTAAADAANADFQCSGTDDGAVLNDAMDFVVAAGGGSVEILDGTLHVGLTAPNLPTGPVNLHVFGQGMGATVFQFDLTPGNGYFFAGADCDRFTLSDVTFDGQSRTNCLGVSLTGSRIVVDGVEFHDMSGDDGHLEILLPGDERAEVVNCVFADGADTTAFLHCDAAFSVIAHNRFKNALGACVVASGDNTAIGLNTFDTAAGNAVTSTGANCVVGLNTESGTSGFAVSGTGSFKFGNTGDTTVADHLADTSDAHDASAISIVDAGAHFTSTEVEGALQEIGAAGGGHSDTGLHTVAQPVAVHKNGTLVGTRKNVNFNEGSNVTITVADDATDDEVDVTIAASGGGGGDTPSAATVNTFEATSSATYTDLATSGPAVTVTVPASGKLKIDMATGFAASAAAQSALVAFALSGGNTRAASDDEAIYGAGTDGRRVGVSFVLEGLTAGSTTVTMKYRSTSGSATFGRRHIIVTPIS